MKGLRADRNQNGRVKTLHFCQSHIGLPVLKTSLNAAIFTPPAGPFSKIPKRMQPAAFESFLFSGLSCCVPHLSPVNSFTNVLNLLSYAVIPNFNSTYWKHGSLTESG